MEKNSCYVGLELTSNAVKLVTGFVLNDLVYVLDCVEEPCSGLENGLIKDSEKTIATIKSVINQTSKNLNIVVREVALIIPPFNLFCMTDTGSTNTIDGNDVIRHVDTSNILTAMKKTSLADPDLKIIDIVPDTFIINNNERYTSEPIGKTSKVLSLHASIYAMNEKVIHQFANCINKAGYEAKYKIIAPYASSLYLSTFNSLPDSYILIDIGHSITTISQVHNRTSIINCRMIKYGGKDITASVADYLQIDINEAEELKCTYGIDHNPIFPVYLKNKIQFDDLSDAIMSSLNPAIDTIKTVVQEFSSMGNEKLPIVLIGGTASLYHLDRVISDALGMKVIEFNMETLGARNKSFVSTLGAIKYSAIQPQVNEEETITTSITRVENKKNNRNYKFDEEL